MPELEGYSILCNDKLETFKAGIDNYTKNFTMRTLKQLSLLDRKNKYEVKKVKITYQEIE